MKTKISDVFNTKYEEYKYRENEDEWHQESYILL